MVQVEHSEVALNVAIASLTLISKGEKETQSRHMSCNSLHEDMSKEHPNKSDKIVNEHYNDNDEECEEVWCNKENEMDLKPAQLQEMKFSEATQTPITKQKLSNNSAQGELALGHSSEREKVN